MDDVECELPLRGDELAGAAGFLFPGGAEVDVDPSGEEVLRVPRALPVAQQHERGHAKRLSCRDSTGSFLGPVPATDTRPSPGGNPPFTTTA